MKRTMAMICVAVMAWSVPAQAEYWNEGNSGDSWETAYVIDSAEDFMTMRNRSYEDAGKYFKLTADLELNIMSENGLFQGHFDGQNHKVQVSGPLFATVSSDAIAIRNLNVEGSVAGDNVVGGIVEGLIAGIIENCSFTGTVETIRNSDDNLLVWAGGIAGSVGKYETIANNREPVIKNCTVSGTVRTSGVRFGSSGGIAASLSQGRIENCTVLSGSRVSSSSTSPESPSKSGGIVGEAGFGWGNGDNDEVLFGTCIITNCTSHAEVTGDYAGGILGTMDNEHKSNVSLSGNTWPSQYPEIGNTPSEAQSQPTSSELPIGVIQPITLSQDVLEKIASTVSADPSQLHSLNDANISAPREPTQAMRDYIQADNSELTGKFNTLSVDTRGWYTFKVTLTDELYNLVKGQKVSSYKFYGLNDSESQVSASFINGLLGTWELFSLNGESLDSFGAKEFLMVGLLDAGTPFSVYLTKIIIALLAGGCSSGFFAGGLAILALLTLKLRRR